MHGDYIAATVQCSSNYYLLMLNNANQAFTVKSFTGDHLFGLATEATTGRFVAGGMKTKKSFKHNYISKFMIHLIDMHPDFQNTAKWSMKTLPSGIEEIISDKNMYFEFTKTAYTEFASIAVDAITNSVEESYSSDIKDQANYLLYYIVKGTSIKITPELP